MPRSSERTTPAAGMPRMGKTRICGRGVAYGSHTKPPSHEGRTGRDYPQITQISQRGLTSFGRNQRISSHKATEITKKSAAEFGVAERNERRRKKGAIGSPLPVSFLFFRYFRQTSRAPGLVASCENQGFVRQGFAARRNLRKKTRFEEVVVQIKEIICVNRRHLRTQLFLVALCLVIFAALCEQFLGCRRRPGIGANARPFRNKNGRRVNIFLFLCWQGVASIDGVAKSGIFRHKREQPSKGRGTARPGERPSGFMICDL